MNNYTEATILFSTGTGNSFRAASWMHEYANKNGICSRLLPMHSSEARGFKRGSSSLVGFVFPTHGFTAPWHIMKFVFKLPRGKGTHSYVMPTRAGTKLGKIFFPGLEGTAGYLISLLLFLKGYSVRGVLALDMPSNWIQVHPGFSRQSAEAIIARAKPIVSRYIDSIINGGTYFGGFVFLLLGILLLPVSLGYVLVGRFGLAKLFFPSYSCNGCGICKDSCPHGGIEMRNKRPYWTFSCEACMRCMNYCPQQAVEASHAMLVFFCWAQFLPVAALLFHGDGTSFFERVVQYAYIIILVYLSYWVLILLNRVGVLNRVFTWTTFTKIFRRYHEPETELRDLKGGPVNHAS